MQLVSYGEWIARLSASEHASLQHKLVDSISQRHPVQRWLIFSGFIPHVLLGIMMPVAIMKPSALSGYDRVIFVIIISLVGSKRTSIAEVGEGRLLDSGCVAQPFTMKDAPENISRSP
jgi:hypothetical protein